MVRLRHQADNCDFINPSQEIADQVIFGISHPNFCTKILENRLEALDKIVKLGKLLESVLFQSRQLAVTDSTASPTVDSVAKLSSSSRPPKREPYRGKPCQDYRSRRHAVNSDECPAKEGTCYRGEKKGHFANCCPDHCRPSSVEKVSSPASSHSKSSGDHKKKDEVKLVKSCSAVDSSDDSDYAFAVSHGRLPLQLEENQVRVKVGGVPMKMYVDSGLSRALFDADTWAQLRRKGIKYCHTKITRNVFRYGKARPLDIRRAVYLRFESTLASTWAKAYILAESEGRCESILGSPVAKQLKILRVGEKPKFSREDDAIR